MEFEEWTSEIEEKYYPTCSLKKLKNTDSYIEFRHSRFGTAIYLQFVGTNQIIEDIWKLYSDQIDTWTFPSIENGQLVIDQFLTKICKFKMFW